MLTRRVNLKNILSFGSDARDLELKPLNILIVPGGSGKSNFIEMIGLLKAAPSDIAKPTLKEDGTGDWLRRRQPKTSMAEIEVIATRQAAYAENARQTLLFVT